MEKRLHEISRFFVAPRCEFAPAVCARPRTPFSINTFTSVLFSELDGVRGRNWSHGVISCDIQCGFVSTLMLYFGKQRFLRNYCTFRILYWQAQVGRGRLDKFKGREALYRDGHKSVSQARDGFTQNFFLPSPYKPIFICFGRISVSADYCLIDHLVSAEYCYWPKWINPPSVDHFAHAGHGPT